MPVFGETQISVNECAGGSTQLMSVAPNYKSSSVRVKLNLSKTMAVTSTTSIMTFLYALLLGAYYVYVEDPSSFTKRVAEGIAIGCVVVTWILRRRRRDCYLVDFTCYRAPDDQKMNSETSMYFACEYQRNVADILELQWRLFQRSGLGEETSGPRFLFNGKGEASLEEARVEIHECFGAILDRLFAQTFVHPQQIDILIVTISTFTTAPSHTSWIINRYRMKESMKAFAVAGMGCSAIVVAVDMAKDLLRLYPDSYALVVGTESLSVNTNYRGNDRTMILPSVLFRLGGTALLLSNKPQEARRAKMRLMHVVRTNIGADDEAYGCVMVKEDVDGNYGTSLLPQLIPVAANAMGKNLAILGPRVLPLRELLYYVVHNMLCIKLFKMNLEPYVPNFRLAFQHFCVQPGGRGVLDGIAKSLGLTELDMEPSRMALHRFGNTSVSGIWNEVAYMEAKGRLKPGDRVLQIGLGSGFKCNTAVWKVLRESHPLEMKNNVWSDCADRYPCDTRNKFPADYCRPYFNAF